MIKDTIGRLPEIDGDAGSVEVGLELLRRHGALVIRRAADPSIVRLVGDQLEPHFRSTPFSQGLFYGDQTVRFGRIFARSRASWTLAVEGLPHAIAEQVLRTAHRDYAISFSQAIAVHPGSPAQAPHRDGEMWPVALGSQEHLVSIMWPLSRFDATTGGTAVWPRSDPSARVQADLAPGDALLFLGSTTHGGGANRSEEIRRGLVIGYAAAWLVPAENPGLSYPPEVAHAFPPELARLVGYRRFAPNLNNYDCRCPSELLSDAAMRGAVDELHPEQVASLRQFCSSQADIS